MYISAIYANVYVCSLYKVHIDKAEGILNIYIYIYICIYIYSSVPACTCVSKIIHAYVQTLVSLFFNHAYCMHVHCTCFIYNLTYAYVHYQCIGTDECRENSISQLYGISAGSYLPTYVDYMLLSAFFWLCQYPDSLLDRF